MILIVPGKVYSFKKLPLVGGEFDVSNVWQLDIYEHYNLTGDLHFKLKDLQDDTEIEFVEE